MPELNHDLLDLIGSRICHDIISPLGAIGNGVELLTMSGAASGPEMDLISQSVSYANGRIRYFRVSFGPAREAQVIGQSEILSILREITQDGRLTVDWKPSGDVARNQVKLAFLLLQCLESAMPRGGQITVNLVAGQWAIHGEADQIIINPDLWEILSRNSSVAELDAAHVHFALAAISARSLNRRLSVETSKHSARIQY